MTRKNRLKSLTLDIIRAQHNNNKDKTMEERGDVPATEREAKEEINFHAWSDRAVDRRITFGQTGPVAPFPHIAQSAQVTNKKSEPALSFLKEAATQMEQRAQLRDTPNGERTAKKIAEVFNAITGHNLTEADAWMFLVVLKIVRSRSGKYSRDDYVDLAAYASLLGEHESTTR